MNEPPRTCDFVVIGGGILGLAVARELLGRHADASLCVLEREPRLAAHQTSHSSGVIHAGIYYAPGSLKARLCVEGARQLIAFCEERDIPFQRCGKVIVATSEDEVPRLEELHRRALANGVDGAELIGRERLAELEPHAAGVRALRVPTTGIADFVGVARAYEQDVLAAGGSVLVGHEVTGVTTRGQRVLVTSQKAQAAFHSEIRAGQVYVNTYGAGGGVELPFGGYKKSGYGREKGLDSLASYTQIKNVCVRFA